MYIFVSMAAASVVNYFLMFLMDLVRLPEQVNN